jgi:hypothetical protein
LDVPEHGDCACCEGGIHHQSLAESAERLRKDSFANSDIPIHATSSLPVLQTGSGCGPRGCSSCGMPGVHPELEEPYGS